MITRMQPSYESAQCLTRGPESMVQQISGVNSFSTKGLHSMPP